MSLSLWTPLFSALIAFAMATKVLLRSRKRRPHWLFIMFATNVAVWYLATFLEARNGGGLLSRFAGLMAVLLPQTGVRFLRGFSLDAPDQPSSLDRWATRLLVPMLALVASPWFTQKITGAVIRAVLLAYVVGLLIAAVSALSSRGRVIASQHERRRARYLVGLGVLATLVTTADLVPFMVNRVVAANLPPIGSILVLAVLYMFSEVIERRRVIDLYELAGRFVVLTALALVLAGIYYRLVDWQVLTDREHRHEGPYFLNAIVASLVILILFDPLRDKMEAQIARFFFGERYDFETSINELRRRLAHALEPDEMGRVLMDGLSRSRRVTSASLYLVDADRKGLDLTAQLGDTAERRVDLASLRALIDHARAHGIAVKEQLERDADDRRELGETREGESIAELAHAMESLSASVALPLEGEGNDLLGLLTLRDDRVRDAFAGDEFPILKGLAAQVAIVVENTRLYARIKERDRLAALGEMAAGLAHEIRNPLGAIKGAAQWMESTMPAESDHREFIGIIVDEVGRLDRVVSSFLDYARPYRGNPSLLDVTNVVERTLQLVRNDIPAELVLTHEPGDELPPVRMDPEHLRQVLLNLIRNAMEAMKGRGSIVLRSRTRGSFVELLVRDSGPGIEASMRKNLFIPFSTTKTQGTGLGLAISQRLIQSAGGRIELRASGDQGTTFCISLPAAVSGTPTAPSGSIPPPPRVAADAEAVRVSSHPLA
nr:two-component system sensor protein [Deltaproteobacteria bacterium]